MDTTSLHTKCAESCRIAGSSRVNGRGVIAGRGNSWGRADGMKLQRKWGLTLMLMRKLSRQAALLLNFTSTSVFPLSLKPLIFHDFITNLRLFMNGALENVCEIEGQKLSKLLYVQIKMIFWGNSGKVCLIEQLIHSRLESSCSISIFKTSLQFHWSHFKIKPIKHFSIFKSE